MKKAIASVLVATIALVGPAAAAAGGTRDVVQRGSCSGSSNWKLKLSPQDGRIEAEFEVDQNVVGDRWRVRINHDGDRAFRGVRTTHGDSGSFEVRIVENDSSGPDRFAARARNLSTGEVCVGRATF